MANLSHHIMVRLIWITRFPHYSSCMPITCMPFKFNEMKMKCNGPPKMSKKKIPRQIGDIFSTKFQK